MSGRLPTSQSASLQQIAFQPSSGSQVAGTSSKMDTSLKKPTTLLPPPLPPRSNSRHQFASSSGTRVTPARETATQDASGSPLSDPMSRSGGAVITTSKKDTTESVIK
ncbi:unnamed protein product [Echinostoma caproni]|uniref:Uncharacterized protein n=1 Tax=Echinostoma caproni TaxID=27848 RepID=A0A183AHR4_9TREM|nr:unnamed protein product [Echinostoma caproni]